MMVLEAMKHHRGHTSGVPYGVMALRVWDDDGGARVVTNGHGQKSTERFGSLEAALRRAERLIEERGYEVTRNKLGGADGDFDFSGGRRTI